MDIQATWLPGFSSLYKGVDPQKVMEEIMSIGPSATPAQILDKGQDPETELHKCFEWDDTEAARRWRIQQARQIVCHLVYKQDTTDANPPVKVRVFYKADARDGYKPTTIIMRDKDAYDALLSRALSELTAFRNKYATLTELETLFDDIDKLTA